MKRIEHPCPHLKRGSKRRRGEDEGKAREGISRDKWKRGKEKGKGKGERKSGNTRRTVAKAVSCAPPFSGPPVEVDGKVELARGC